MSYNGDIARRLWEWKGLTPKDGMVGGWKAVHPDLTTRAGFQWPTKGKVRTKGPWTKGDPCPSAPGDGLCIAVTFRGAASGGIPAITGLLVKYADADVLGSDVDKVRVTECRVVGLLDIPRAAREGVLVGANLVRANLGGANLGGARLDRADLGGAYLVGANLVGANLDGATLDRANLGGANLGGARLDRANLGGAYLVGANLVGANLGGAYLVGANLDRAYLGGANLDGARLDRADLGGARLDGAYLVGARLDRADLGGAYLDRANLVGALADRYTRWPNGFDPATRGVIVR